VFPARAQPVLAAEVADPGELALGGGDQRMAESERVGGDQQIVGADSSFATP
jgi:hypothetical protein